MSPRAFRDHGQQPCLFFALVGFWRNAKRKISCWSRMRLLRTGRYLLTVSIIQSTYMKGPLWLGRSQKVVALNWLCLRIIQDSQDSSKIYQIRVLGKQPCLWGVFFFFFIFILKALLMILMDIWDRGAILYDQPMRGSEDPLPLNSVWSTDTQEVLGAPVLSIHWLEHTHRTLRISSST